MYVRITRVQSPPDRLDDIVRYFKEDAVPAVRQLSGYEGAVLAVDRASGDGQAVTFWDSLESLKASEEAATGIRTRTVAAGGGEVAGVQRLEVALLERRGAPQTPAFLRVIRGKADPSRIDAMIQATRDQALPLLRNVTGFVALNVAVDRQSGDAVITGVYQTAEAREAGGNALADVRTSIFEQAGSAPPQISLYEAMSVEFVHAAATV